MAAHLRPAQARAWFKRFKRKRKKKTNKTNKINSNLYSNNSSKLMFLKQFRAGDVNCCLDIP